MAWGTSSEAAAAAAASSMVRSGTSASSSMATSRAEGAAAEPYESPGRGTARAAAIGSAMLGGGKRPIQTAPEARPTRCWPAPCRCRAAIDESRTCCSPRPLLLLLMLWQRSAARPTSAAPCAESGAASRRRGTTTRSRTDMAMAPTCAPVRARRAAGKRACRFPASRRHPRTLSRR